MNETKMKMSDSTSAQKAQQDEKKDANADMEAGKEETKYEATAKKPVVTKPPPKIEKPRPLVKKPSTTTKPVKVEVIKIDASEYSGPVKSLYILVGGKNVYAMKDKGEIVVTTYGQAVHFVANTGGKNVGPLYFEVPDMPEMLQSSPKYVFNGKWLENKKFPIIITHYTENDKTEFKVEITLY